MRTPPPRGQFTLTMAAASGGGTLIVSIAIVVPAGYAGSEANGALAMAASRAGPGQISQMCLCRGPS